MNESFHIHNCSGFAVLVGHGESGESFVYLHFLIYIPDLLWGFHGIFTNLIEAILAAVFYSGLFEVSAGGVLSFLPFSNMYRLEWVQLSMKSHKCLQQLWFIRVRDQTNPDDGTIWQYLWRNLGQQEYWLREKLDRYFIPSRRCFWTLDFIIALFFIIVFSSFLVFDILFFFSSSSEEVQW